MVVVDKKIGSGCNNSRAQTLRVRVPLFGNGDLLDKRWAKILGLQK